MGWAARDKTLTYEGTKGARPLTARQMVLQPLVTPQKAGRRSRRLRRHRWVPR